MKLVTYDDGPGPRAGVIVDDEVVDAATALDVDGLLRDVQALLERPDSPVDRLRDAVERGQGLLRIPLSKVRLRPPILRPPTFRDFALFEEHVTQQFTLEGKMNDVWRQMPIFYFSNTLRIGGHDDVINYPAGTAALDYECEIGMVIGREGTNVLEADADYYIAGFTILNDWTTRDILASEIGAMLGPHKGKDAATTIGPCVVTPDELGDRYRDGVLSLRCQVRVNGITWTDRSSWNMYHTFGAMIERASQDSRVVPGDVLGSGTVGGGTVREAARLGYPAHWIQPGDVVELEIERLGVLRNTVGPATNTTSRRFTSPLDIPLPSTMADAERDAVLARVTAPPGGG